MVTIQNWMQLSVRRGAVRESGKFVRRRRCDGSTDQRRDVRFRPDVEAPPSTRTAELGSSGARRLFPGLHLVCRRPVHTRYFNLVQT